MFALQIPDTTATAGDPLVILEKRFEHLLFLPVEDYAPCQEHRVFRRRPDLGFTYVTALNPESRFCTYVSFGYFYVQRFPDGTGVR